ncbi:TonB-linked outer membrane protein, SusC/RagA family [Arenibacter nanhaiticus]|uniref:TonB-linked outer membrane protein, SusC/RagA family n=1 Tax=Arenibacter nanhaiticus TaxID=558155 RepID=A0A1M6MCP7_9FLAO|nr:TonB-dependent receptor [Arenibacter nanhaiticus]SHJ81187.1 TonB-linked outer membrane protein, SusC/RagA family [Arenibacter nanhaiticus]
MKKLFNLGGALCCPFKLSLKMKLSVLLTIVSLFQIHANTYSQNKEISLDISNVSLKTVINQIEAVSEFKFLLNRKDVDLNRKVSIRVEKEKITTILTELFANTNVAFEVLNKQIILKKREVITQSSQKSGKEKNLNPSIQFQVSGTIADQQGQPLPGANIVEKGTTNGVTADFDGNFSLAVASENAVLIISYIGYATKEVAVNGQARLSVLLNEDASALDEVVITGYTAERKSDLTGAVAIVEMDEVVSQPVASVDNMLQGRVSGVELVSSGAPGGASTLRIRGYSTIRNNDPLYIIDGVPTTTGINLINPNDIASLQVLKDASSSSIYGSRAANGVVIITTKKGKSEVVKVSFDMHTGIQNANNLPNNLNAQEYGDVYWQAFNNDGITPSHGVYGNGTSPIIPAFLDEANTIPSANTDWVAEIFDPAIIQSYNLNFSKGGEKSRSMFSLGYFDQEGTLKNTDFKRITARLNSDYKLFNDKVTVGENLTVAYSNSVGTNTNSLLGNAVYDAYRIPSIAPIYDINGDFTGYPLSDVQNPLGNLERNKYNDVDNLRVFGNVYSEIQLFKELTFKTNFGVNYSTLKGTNFNPSYKEPNAQRAINNLSVRDEVKWDWVWSNTLNYSKTVNEKHNFNVLLGIESIENLYEVTTASIDDLPTNELNIRVLNAGDQGTQTNTGDKIEYSLFSYFGKLNYSLDNKYLFSATLRRDGTSKLLNNRWGTFPALSVGWKISEEDFFNDEGAISNLKLRAGWGLTGNQDIPAYQTVSGFSSNPFYSNYAINGSQNSTETGFTLSRIANPDLKWETTTQTNIGLDFGFLDNSITVSADYFIKNTDDLLLFKTLPADQSGITNRGQWQNVGEMQNKGFELAASYQSDPRKDFNYEVGVNFSVIDNKLMSLGEGIEFIETDPGVLHNVNFDQSTSRTGIGQPIASFYGHVVDGIFQNDAEAASSSQPSAKAGDYKFRDLNGDGSISDADRTYLGSPHADFTYGINFSASYKAFDFTLFFQGSQGNDIYDLSRYYSDFFNLANYNKSGRILNAWTPQNTDTDLARVSLNDPNNNIRPSSFYVQDGSYLRLKTLQVGYSFPESIAQRIKASRVRIYLEAYNLLTITSYEGLDPEIGLQNYDSDERNLDIGVDRGIYPSSQTFTFGINLNF